MKLLPFAAAICGSLAVVLPRPEAPETPPPVGPGGVMDAVQTFLRAIDAGNTSLLRQCLVVPGDQGGVAFGAGEDGRLRTERGARRGRFFDVAYGGETIQAQDSKAFASRLRAASCSKIHARTLITKVHSIVADCPSGNCSFAVVEFERQYRIGSKPQPPIPMQATVLVKHVVRKENSGLPHFRIFHWHASRKLLEQKEQDTIRRKRSMKKSMKGSSKTPAKKSI